MERELVCTSRRLENELMPCHAGYRFLSYSNLLVIVLVARCDTRIRNAFLRGVPSVDDVRLFRTGALHHGNVRAYRTGRFTAIEEAITLDRRFGQWEAYSLTLLAHHVQQAASQDLVHLTSAPQRPQILHEPATAVLTVFHADRVAFGLVLAASVVADVDPVQSVFLPFMVSLGVIGLAELLWVWEDAIPQNERRITSHLVQRP